MKVLPLTALLAVPPFAIVHVAVWGCELAEAVPGIIINKRVAIVNASGAISSSDRQLRNASEWKGGKI